MAPSAYKVSPYLIVEPATLLQRGQISLCDSQFESGTQNMVWITLSQRTTHSCCHFLDNQFTQGSGNYSHACSRPRPQLGGVLTLVS